MRGIWSVAHCARTKLRSPDHRSIGLSVVYFCPRGLRMDTAYSKLVRHQEKSEARVGEPVGRCHLAPRTSRAVVRMTTTISTRASLQSRAQVLRWASGQCRRSPPEITSGISVHPLNHGQVCRCVLDGGVKSCVLAFSRGHLTTTSGSRTVLVSRRRKSTHTCDGDTSQPRCTRQIDCISQNHARLA